MIAELALSAFLVQAVPAPAASFHDERTTLATFHQLMEFLFWKDDSPESVSGDFNVLLVGGGALWVKELRRRHMNAFGLSDAPSTPWEVTSNLLHYPIRGQSMSVVGYLLSSTADPWVASGLLSECASTIVPGGYLFFNPAYGRHWPRLLKSLGWEYIPIQYHRYQIWKKPVDERPHGVVKIQEAA